MSRNVVAGRVHTLIVRSQGGWLEALTIAAGEGEEVLPVLSFREEAEMYLQHFGALGRHWRARKTSSGELASILCGPCREVGAVVLDPLPEACGVALNDLLGVRREEFVLALLDKRRKLAQPKARTLQLESASSRARRGRYRDTGGESGCNRSPEKTG